MSKFFEVLHVSGTPECWTNIITFYYSFHVPAPLGEYPKLLYTPPRGFNFPPSPVSRSIGLIQIVFRLDTWSFRLGCSSLAQLMFGTPTHRRLSLRHTQNSIPLPVSHSNSSGFLPDLTLFHFVFAPAFQSLFPLGS